MIEEIKEKGLVEKAKATFREAIDNLLNGSDIDVVMNLGAIIAFVFGAILLGIGIQFSTTIFIIPGAAMIVLGIVRFMHQMTDGFS